jgi:hypothetical protein
MVGGYDMLKSKCYYVKAMCDVLLYSKVPKL